MHIYGCMSHVFEDTTVHIYISLYEVKTFEYESLQPSFKNVLAVFFS